MEVCWEGRKYQVTGDVPGCPDDDLIHIAAGEDAQAALMQVHDGVVRAAVRADHGVGMETH